MRELPLVLPAGLSGAPRAADRAAHQRRRQRHSPAVGFRDITGQCVCAGGLPSCAGASRSKAPAPALMGRRRTALRSFLAGLEADARLCTPRPRSALQTRRVDAAASPKTVRAGACRRPAIRAARGDHRTEHRLQRTATAALDHLRVLDAAKIDGRRADPARAAWSAARTPTSRRSASETERVDCCGITMNRRTRQHAPSQFLARQTDGVRAPLDAVIGFSPSCCVCIPPASSRPGCSRCAETHIHLRASGETSARPYLSSAKIARPAARVEEDRRRWTAAHIESWRPSSRPRSVLLAARPRELGRRAQLGRCRRRPRRGPASAACAGADEHGLQRGEEYSRPGGGWW